MRLAFTYSAACLVGASLVLAKSIPQLEITMEDWRDTDGKTCSSSGGSCQPLKVKCKLPEDLLMSKSADSTIGKVMDAVSPSDKNSTKPADAAQPPAAPKTSAAKIAASDTGSTAGASASAPAASGGSSNSTSTGSSSAAPTASGGSSNTTAPATTGGSSNTTSTSGGSGGSDIAPSADEFNNAITSCGYTAPSGDTYKNFVATIPKSAISSKKELAAFLAQILHESAGLTAKEEIACKNNACPGQYDSGPGGQYYGRGYIQLTWKANYQAASMALYNNDSLVQHPDTVASDDAIAWDTASFFWKTNVHGAPGVQQGKFGAATKAINGALECSGGANPQAKDRFDKYTKILKAWSITDTPDESGCYN